MYGWLWRHLPGPVPIRILQSLVIFAGLVVLLLLVIFPAVEPHLPFGDVTINKK